MDKWITAGEIAAYAAAHGDDCQGLLPELVQRLIFATATTIDRIVFPTRSAISLSGWDGELEADTSLPFFPSGVSGWEVSIERPPTGKADRDYKKRVANPLGLVPSQTTFVFVTPHLWNGRGTWEHSKRSKNEWRDVRAIGADGLETWLAAAPAVAAWFARKIGKLNSDGIRDLEEAWDEWSGGTEPKLTPDVLLAGRAAAKDALHQWMRNRPGILKLRGDSPDEAFAFLHAAITALPEHEPTQALSRCIVVENITQLRACTRTFRNPLIIAGPEECIDAAPSATDKGHHVFLSMIWGTLDYSNVVTLPRCPREPLEKALCQAGMSEIDAQRHVRDSGRSIPVLRRHIFRYGLGRAPAWAEAQFASTLIPTLLAGAWSDDTDGDRLMLEQLSGKPYDDFVREFSGIAQLDDSPIRHIGSVWMLKSPLDAWFLLARHLDKAYLQSLLTSINTVLSKTNPKYDLPPAQQWAAPMYGKSSPYSRWIRKGMVESLVLFAIYGDAMSTANIDSQGFADSVVSTVLNAAESWEAWASLTNETALLAEASPDAFLGALERKLDQQPNLLKDLMSDDATTFGECRHSGALWGLEALAWNPIYLARAAAVLHRLAQVDPGGQWSNRPANSLRALFLPARPQTYASPEDRLAVFDSVADNDPEMAWQFIDGYMRGASVSPAHQFRWRDSGGTRSPLEPESRDWHRDHVAGLLARAQTLVNATPGNLAAAVDHFVSLTPDLQKTVITAINGIDESRLTKSDRDHLLDRLRHTLSWINSFAEADLRKSVPDLEKALERLTPDDVRDRVAWLFEEPWPSLPQGMEKDFRAKQALLDEARKRATRELMDNLPIFEVLEFGKKLKYPGIFGHALGKAVRNRREDRSVIDALAHTFAQVPDLLVSFSIGRVEIVGEHWVAAEVKRAKESNFRPGVVAALYRGLPENRVSWKKVEREGTEVEREYWATASGYSHSDRPGDASIAVTKLTTVGRLSTALQVAGSPDVAIDVKLIKSLLEGLLALEEPEKRQLTVGPMFEYYVNKLFEQLYESKGLSLDEIAKLEWPYVAIFHRHGVGSHAPVGLHNQLATNPGFFASFVALLYKDDKGTVSLPEGMTEAQFIDLANNAQELFETWREIPGATSEGSVDANLLNQWVDAVRKKCQENKHLTGCDLKLAEIFARAPIDPDGNWPHKAVRDLLERLQSKLIESQIPFAVYNSRGVVTKSLDSGGEQERELAEKYRKMSNAVRIKWPRTAVVLDAIASMYDRDAKHEDIHSTLNDFWW